MKLFKFQPGRPRIPESEIVLDLDKLIADPVPFRLNGKTHLIKPLSAIQFLQANQMLARMDALRKKEEITEQELMEGYLNLIQSVCDTFTKKDFDGMTMHAVGALYQLVLDFMTGKVHNPEYEKKNSPNLPKISSSSSK